jgi:MoxR-like ATPase
MSTTEPIPGLIPQLKSVVDPLNQWLFGLEEPMAEVLVALLCGGHILLEGPPGTAKTLMVKLMAQSFSCPFKRVQFTPDLMPADIIGTNIFNQQRNEFQFNPGPLFTTFLLADEINRTPAKTQSALLECMQERQVTVDGTHYTLSPLFTVFATQNPIEHEGTYPLPEAQLDRFLFKILIPYPDRQAELDMLKNHHHQAPGSTNVSVPAVINEPDMIQLRQKANDLTIEDSIMQYILDLVQQTRQHPSIAIGASPRASILWLKAAKAVAFMEQRDYVIPDDIKKIGKPLLRHRLMLYPQAELEGRTADGIVDELFLKVKPPR